MLPTITKIYNRSDFTIQLPLAEGYDGQEFRFTIYTCGEIENGWVASYIDGVYTNCSVENDIVTIYVNNNNQMNPGCVTVQSEYDYFNSHFIDNEDNVKDVYKTNIYLVSYKTNAFSASFRPSNLPDLTGSSEYVTLSYLTTTLEDYVTDEELQSQLEDFVTEEDFAAELSNYITDEELTDMGFLTQSDIDQMGYATVAYLNEKLSSKQNLLVSGQNIKTINGYSLLGSGNIDITDAGSIDLSYYVTYDYLSSQSYVTSYDVSDFVTQQDVQNILVDGAYVTSNELSNMGYVTYQFLDQASYVTQNELSQMGYVTQSQLSANSYITINDVPVIDTSSYVTHTELNNAGYVDGTYVADYVSQHAPTPDLSAYVTKTELSAAGYLTAIPSEYITESELDAMGYIPEAALGDYVTETELSQAGYLTAIPSEYVTESEIATMGYITDTELSNVLSTASYVTQNELSNAGYITNSDLSQASYVTQNELSNMGYITTIPAEYVTDTELSNIGYVTQAALSGMSYATTSDLTSKQDTLVSGTNIKTINNTSLLGSGNLTITGGSSISEVTQAEYDAMEQAGTLAPDILYIITDAQSADLDDYATLTYLETYYASQAYVVNYVATYAPMPDLSAYVTQTSLNQELGSYVTKTELNNASYVTKTELNNASYVTQTELNNASYVTQTELNNASYVTQTSLSNNGYLTSANFIYDSTTNSLTISI